MIVWPNRISDYCLKKRSSYIIRILQQTFWKQLRRNDLFSSKITIYGKNCRQLSILFHYIYIALTKFIFHSLCMNLKIYTSCNITLWMNSQKYLYTYVPKYVNFFRCIFHWKQDIFLKGFLVLFFCPILEKLVVIKVDLICCLKKKITLQQFFDNSL